MVWTPRIMAASLPGRRILPRPIHRVKGRACPRWRPPWALLLLYRRPQGHPRLLRVVLDLVPLHVAGPALPRRGVEHDEEVAHRHRLVGAFRLGRRGLPDGGAGEEEAEGQAG